MVDKSKDKIKGKMQSRRYEQRKRRGREIGDRIIGSVEEKEWKGGVGGRVYEGRERRKTNR